jgi:FkbM family methyltransferase
MSTIRKIKSGIHSVAKLLLPGFYSRRQFKYFEAALQCEVELQLLPFLCEREKSSLDIGAAGGLYMVHMIKYSSACIAFEPIPKAGDELEKFASKIDGNIVIERIALSDTRGQATLRMLKEDLGRSTIENENKLEDNAGGKKISITVPMKPLDDYNYTNIGLVKIDVEGHELSVLKGSTKLITHNYPSFIVEIEDRHKENAIKDVTDFLMGYGYKCYFILNSKLIPFSEFNKCIHQDAGNIGDSSNNYIRKGIYINNFVFVSAHKEEELLKAAKTLLQ